MRLCHGVPVLRSAALSLNRSPARCALSGWPATPTPPAQARRPGDPHRNAGDRSTVGVHASRRTTSGMVKQGTDVAAPCMLKRQAVLAGGLASATLPPSTNSGTAGFKGA